MRYSIGLDVSGTNLSAGVVDETGTVISHAVLPADAGRSIVAITSDMAEVSRMAVRNAGMEISDMSSWGIGMPSCINPATGLLVHANCFGWRNVPIGEYLLPQTELPLYIENDANCAVLGEMVAGAAKSFRNVIMLTLGTGVGGGIILNGTIYAGADRMGAELGHTKLVFGGRKCTCGQSGCLDGYCSARGLVETAVENLTEKSALWALCHYDIRKLEAQMITQAAVDGDSCAESIWDLYISQLAAAIGNFIAVFRPEIVILGGGVAKAGQLLLEPLKQKVAESTFAASEIGIPEIRLAEAGNDAGIIGAAMLEQYGAKRIQS